MSATDSLHRLRAANPFPADTAETLVDPSRAVADLERILADCPAGMPTKSRRRWALPATATAAAAAAVAVFVQPFGGGGGGVAFAATPPPLSYSGPGNHAAAKTHLSELALRAAATPSSPLTGTLAIHTKSWSLNTRVTAAQSTSYVAAADVTTLVTPDGRVSDSTSGAQSAATWTSTSLSSDPASLEEQLHKGHPVEGGTGELFVAVQDLYREAAPTPATRAAILSLLASKGDVTYGGTVVDRAGRSGVAFDTTTNQFGLPERLTLIFDPATGALLDKEEMLTETAGKLNVKIPCVLSYEVYVSADQQP